jgi:uncharacterized protein YprB with RNaseH-like and TPR domain
VTARSLLIDIETAPSLGWVWSKWETNVIDFVHNGFMLSFAYKWLNEGKVEVKGLCDYKGYNKNPQCDKALVKDLWTLLDQADIVIAHNGDRFDIPKINARFLIHGLNPPTPFKTVDTLKVARSVFKVDSNKLDDWGHYLNIGRKLPHTGFHLWLGCINKVEKSWITMKRYNKKDVELLEKFYYILRPWVKNHPNVSMANRDCCPKCSSNKVQKRGFTYTLLRKKQRWQCLNCRGWFEGAAK